MTNLRGSYCTYLQIIFLLSPVGTEQRLESPFFLEIVIVPHRYSKSISVKQVDSFKERLKVVQKNKNKNSLYIHFKTVYGKDINHYTTIKQNPVIISHKVTL